MSWLRRGVVYQVYPRSFQDADGDGVGDLRGLPPPAADGVLAYLRGGRFAVVLNLTGEERALALGGRAGDVVLSARGKGAGRQVAGELRIAGDDALVIRLDGR